MKHHIMWAAVVAIVLSVLTTAPAGAVEFLLAEFLAAGAKITTAQAADGEGEVELISLNGGGFGVAIKVLCSGIFDGTVGPGSEGSTTKLLTLAGVEVSSTPLSGTGLACTNDGNCAGPEVWAVGLPWRGEVALMVDGTETFFAGLSTSLGGYYVECTVLGVKIAEECTVAQAAGQLTNEANGTVDGTASDAFQTLAGLKLGTCTLGGAEKAEVNGLGFGLLTSGTALTISSE